MARTRSESMQRTAGVYRIGLFGRSNAGKTSLLLALSDLKDSALVEGRRWSVAYLPPVKGQGHDPVAYEKLKRGDELLSAARAAMRAEGRTPVTPEDAKTTLSRFQLACDGSSVIIELWDFAGEILAPSRLGDTESHGHALAKRIAHADGMLMLAPADDGSEESVLDAERTEQVIQAIARLHDWIKSHDELADVRERPFALLITKADRTPSGALALEEYGEPAVQAMHAIESLIGADRTRWFPLSALPGHSRADALLAPLIWAVDAIDSQVLAYAQVIRSQSVFRVGIKHKFRATEYLTRLINRRKTARSSDQILSGARYELAKIRKALLGFAGILATFSLSAIFVCLSLLDKSRATTHSSMLSNPNATESVVRAAQDYLDRYDQGWRQYLLFRLSAEELGALKRNASELLANRMMNQVRSESDLAAQKSHAEQLLGSYPGTSHAPEAVQILESISRTETARKYEEWIAALELEAADPLLDADGLGELAKRLTSTPSVLQEDEAQRGRRVALREKVLQRGEEQRESANVTNLLRHVEQAIKDALPSECLRALQKNKGLLENQEVKRMIAGLKVSWRDCIQDCAVKAKAQAAFERGITELKRTLEYESVATEVLKIQIKEGVDEAIDGLTDAWDRYEYDLLCKRPQLKFAEDYLESGHRKCMEPVVLEWKLWHEGLDQVQELTLRLTEVHWDQKEGPDDPMLDFFVNEVEVLKKRRLENDAAGEHALISDAVHQLSSKPSSTIKIELALWDYDLFNRDDYVTGLEENEISLVGLMRSGLTLRLVDGQKVHKVKFRVDGYPSEPELKVWTPCK